MSKEEMKQNLSSMFGDKSVILDDIDKIAAKTKWPSAKIKGCRSLYLQEDLINVGTSTNGNPILVLSEEGMKLLGRETATEKSEEKVKKEKVKKEKVEKEKKPKKEKVEKEKKTKKEKTEKLDRPKAATLCGQIWDFLDGMKKKLKRIPTMKEASAEIEANKFTLTRQYYEWRARQE